MNGQDVVIALKLAIAGSSHWTFAKLATAVGLSPSQALASVRRLRLSGLVSDTGWRIATAELADFLIHGLPCVFPATIGGVTVGVPTASAVDSVRQNLGLASGRPLVWPYPAGSMRGEAIKPLHRSVPRVALHDPPLHEMLALVDCLRIGRPRERGIAARVLRARLAA